MGWGKFLGDLAKDFAAGYIEERGVKGTVEDISSLAKGLFSNDSDSSDVDDLINEYDALINDGEPDKAIALIKGYYKNNHTEKDNIYNYLVGNAFYSKAADTYDLQTANKAKQHICDAKRHSPIGDDIYNTCEELLSDIDSLIANIKRSNAVIENWNKTCDKVAELTDNKEFDKASEILLSHYQKFENGELDSFYWVEMAKIYYACHAYATTQNAIDNYYSQFLSSLSKAENLSDSAKQIEEIKNIRKWEKHVLNIPTTQHSTPTTENNSMNDKELEYLNELKECLENDGTISDRERRLLDKLRSSLGISEERAKELEKQISNVELTSDEEEYFNELKSCYEDGEISDKERRLLNRLYKSLGISDSRAVEIEALVRKSNN